MVQSYAKFLVRRSVSWTVVVLTVLLSAVALVMAGQVEQDDDVLAFLPKTNPDIQAFYEINNRFGGTDVAIVGLDPEDPFDPEFLTKLQAADRALRDTPGLDSVLTLTNVLDFRKDPMGGVTTDKLVGTMPTSPEEVEALREHTLSREHIVGTLVSESGRQTVILGFLARGEEPRAVANAMRDVVGEHLAGVPVYWGGAPFISTWIYDTTEKDMAALTPWAVVVILFIMMLAFRDVVGTALGLTATVIGIGVSRGLMAAFGVSFNIVLSSMPIILFAIGSAYAIHMLSHYNHHAGIVGPGPEAVERTIVGTGPTVLAAGMTTVAGLLSFLMMDIQPMRTFGLFTAIGIFTALMLSLTFVPAMMALFPRPVRKSLGGPLLPVMRGIARKAHEDKTVFAVVVVLISLAGLTFAGRVDARMDLSAFFEADTEPALGQAFLEEHFGGSQYVQVQLVGDLENPDVLREFGRIGDRIRQVEHVTDVKSIDGIVAIINDAMTDAVRVPDTKGQVSTLYRLLSSDPSVSRLVTDERDAALMAVKIGSTNADDLDAVLAEVEQIIETDAATGYRIIKRSDDAATVDTQNARRMATRLRALGVQYGATVSPKVAETLGTMLQVRPWKPSPAAVRTRLANMLMSEESWVPLTREQADTIALGVASLGPTAPPEMLDLALRAAFDEPDESTIADLQVVISAPLPDYWRTAEGVAAGDTVLAELFQVNGETREAPLRKALHSLMEDVNVPSALVKGDEATLAWNVNGMPVLYRGLSRSVTANQFKSLAMALSMVFVIMVLLFRSIPTGFLATLPTLLTLAFVYGGMGAMGVHLDVGTSMLASIIIGAGVDYAVHLLAAWEAGDDETVLDGALRAVDETSHAIWTNAIMVAAGFFVLTLGDARPLQNVGGLTAAAMLAAALSTFAVIPLLARRKRYSR